VPLQQRDSPLKIKIQVNARNYILKKYEANRFRDRFSDTEI